MITQRGPLADPQTEVDALACALELLPARTKTLLTLLYVESCTFAEAALVLDITEAEACATHAAVLHEVLCK